MARDYAKKTYVSPRKKRSPKLGIVISGVLIIFIVSVGLWLKLHPDATFLQRIKSVWTKRTLVASVNNVVKKPQEETAPEIRFSFYDALPNMHVEVPASQGPKVQAVNKVAQVKTVKTENNPDQTKEMKNTPAEPPSYFLQFGLFKEASRASRLRLSLLLAGIETEVEEVNNGQDKNYLVWQGGFQTLSEAKLYQQKGREKGIESILKQED